MASLDFVLPYDGVSRRPPDEVTDFEDGSSMTKQEFAAECDLNLMMKRYVQSGVPPNTVGVGSYDDFYAAPDFLQAQLIVKRAQDQFSELSSDIRERFGNDPARFLAFVGDEKNFEDALKLGLLSDEAKARKAAAELLASSKPASPPAP